MRNILNKIGVAFLLLATIACEDDNVAINPELNLPPFASEQGEPGSVQEAAYNFYEKYGSHIRYSYEESEIRANWTTSWYNWYTPIRENQDEYVKRIINFIDEEVLADYPNSFVRRNLVYKIYLTDSLRTSSSATSSLKVAVDKENAWVVSNCGDQLENWVAKDWTTLKNELVSLFMLSFYNSAPVKPTEFFALKNTTLMVNELTDPEGIYTNNVYSFYMIGFIKYRNMPHGNLNWITPLEAQDLADYITFLSTNTATELSYVFSRFSLMRQRAKVLVPYLKDVLGLDVIEAQNQNCPDDMISSDFYSKL